MHENGRDDDLRPETEGGIRPRMTRLLDDLVRLGAERAEVESVAGEKRHVATRIVEHERDERLERVHRDRDAALAEVDRTAAREREQVTRDLDERLRQARGAREHDLESTDERADEHLAGLRRSLQESVWLAETVYEANEDQPKERMEQRLRKHRARAGMARGAVAKVQARFAECHVPWPAEAAAAPPADARGDDDDEGEDVAGKPASAALKEEAEAVLAAATAAEGRRLIRLYRGWTLLVGFVLVALGLAAFGAWRDGWQPQPQAPAFGGGALVLLVGLWFAGLTAARKRGRRLAADLESRLAGTLATARRAADEARARRVREEAELKATRDRDIRAAKSKYEPRIEEIESRRGSHLDRLASKHDRRIAELESERAERLEAIERHAADERRRAAAQAETEEARIVREAEARLADVEDEFEAACARVRSAFTDGMETCRVEHERLSELDARHFPAWDDPAWDDWNPPAHASPAVVVGRLDCDRRELDGSVPGDEMPERDHPARALPERLVLPLTLDLPSDASLLVESRSLDGRRAAHDILRSTMLRLLAAIPPGKARFTIVDPVGLGESFAGFMQLADHDESFTGPRIWTEPRHIEQRLSDLTEHMENVIQKYLRNRFDTIDAYNREAGEIAEPYRFLVFPDLPEGLNDQAARRLASIVASGARCGVHVLLHREVGRALPAVVDEEVLAERTLRIRERKDGTLRVADDDLGRWPLVPEAAPPDPRLDDVLDRLGRAARDATRVEVPFAVIAPPEGGMWSRSCDRELMVPLGRAGATRKQELAIGRGTSQHALIAGQTGSGKSTLLHVLVTNAALWHGPDQLRLYLVDFKKGVEFKTYATNHLPHAEVVAVESDREFGLSVLQRLDAELQERGDRFRAIGVQDLAGFRAHPDGGPLPRLLLVVDEFQELFVEDDAIAQDAALLLDRLVRQGRAFGLHVLLGSQTLGGSYSLPRSTLGQMQIRIALQCSEADAYTIMADDNSAARLLARPGEAIYNDAGGRMEGNEPFQVVWLPDRVRDEALARVRERAAAEPDRPGCRRERSMVVFEGAAAADLENNERLAAAAEATTHPVAPPALSAWLGEPIAIADPTRAVFRRQSGGHLLLMGQRDEAAHALLTTSMLSLAAQLPPPAAGAPPRFVVLDGSPADSPTAGRLGTLAERIAPGSIHGGPSRLDELFGRVHELLERRETHGDEIVPPVFVVIHGLQRFRALRADDDFGFGGGFSSSSGSSGSSGSAFDGAFGDPFAEGMAEAAGDDASDAAPPPPPVAPAPPSSRTFARLLEEGPMVGLHVLAWCDTVVNLDRTLPRQGLREFEHRVLFQMSSSDSTRLCDQPIASTIGMRRAVLYREETGALEKFRPYRMPDDALVDQIARAAAHATDAAGG